MSFGKQTLFVALFTVALGISLVLSGKSRKPDKDKDKDDPSKPGKSRKDRAKRPPKQVFPTIPDRTYYVACVEQVYDYAPKGLDAISGELITPISHAGVWLYGTDGVSNAFVGSKYYKSVYREFTDDTFTVQVDRTTSVMGRFSHLGVLGPIIRGIEGERVAVVYKNQCSFPNSMHAHGVRYDKTSEGAPYDDQSIAGDSILPGESWTYFWDFRSGMLDQFSSSKLWLYHSHVDEIADTHSGLIGAIIITKKGFETSLQNLRPFDVEREMVAFFILFDETASHLYAQNLREFAPKAKRINTDEFIESNLMHSINGYLFGNLDTYYMNVDDRVRWYVASMGNEGDGPHSPHWHANVLLDRNEAVDTLNVIPATTLTADMLVDNPGDWMFHCHVHDHIVAGMQTMYHVLEAGVPIPL